MAEGAGAVLRDGGRTSLGGGEGGSGDWNCQDLGQQRLPLFAFFPCASCCQASGGNKWEVAALEVGSLLGSWGRERCTFCEEKKARGKALLGWCLGMVLLAGVEEWGRSLGAP